MNCSTPGLPVHHQLLEFTETHVHRVSHAIQPSHPLSSSSPPAPNPSQHQSLFQWVNSSHEVAKVLEFQLQHHSFQRNWLVKLGASLVALSKEPACQCRSQMRRGFDPWVGETPWRRKWQPTPVFLLTFLENPMDREPWQATAHGVTMSGTWLSDWTHLVKSGSLCNFT